MTMYYIHGMSKKSDMHINIPALNPQNAFDLFKGELGQEVTVLEIAPLFDFDYEEVSKIVGVN